MLILHARNLVFRSTLTVIVLVCFGMSLPAIANDKKSNLAVYFAIPDDIHGEQLEFLEDINDRLDNYLAAFFSRGDSVDYHMVRDKELIESARAREIDIFEEQLEGWLAEEEAIESYIKSRSIDYFLIGKFDRAFGGKFSLHWNIVQTNLVTSLNYDAKHKFRLKNDLIIQDYARDPHLIVADIRDALLSYIDSHYAKLTRTNVVFCSCFNLKKSSDKAIELEFLRDNLPRQLASLLRTKMKNITFVEPGSLNLPDVSCDAPDTRRMIRMATRIVTPDIFISGRIYDYLHKNQIKIEMGISKTRNYNNIPPYILEKTKRQRDAELIPEELATSIKTEWSKIESNFFY